ncbi:MAG: serine/threonine-protein kinase, partial [Myxococcota bacterium]|nr:serine/threonine-protein kinase [Myxococcota bacterium]
MKLPFQMGRYTLVELIGAGAFGRVYRAEVHGDMGFVSEFAVKVLDANIVASNPNVAAQMGDEARILSQLDHPNIVKVIDFKHEEHDVLGDVYYMVLEFVRGIDVGLIVEQLETNCEHVPAAAVLHMGLMVADALEHAHQLNGRDGLPLGIVHRDLKPQNLMVNFRGQVKILDFGIAKARDARLAARTQQGQTKGTVFYMSPEQLTGDELDGRADLFSLSSILFELLLGRRLLDVEVATPADLARAMHTAFEMDIDARLDELRAHLEAGHNGELPDEAVDGWIALLRAGLQKEPQFRPESARVMSEQLEWLRARHPVTDHRNFWARQASFGLERNSGPFQMPLEDVPLVDDEPDSEISPAEDFFGMHSGSVADEAVARTGRPEIPPPEVPVTRAMSVVEGTVRDFGSDSLRSVTSPPNISIMPTLQDGALEAESQSSADETADVAQTLETAAHDPNKAVPLDAESSVDAEPTVAFDGQTELDATVPFARDRKSRLEDTPTDMVPALSKTSSPAGREGGLSSLLLPLVVGLALIVVGISLFLVLRGGNEASEDRPPLNASAESPASPAQASAGKATAGTVDAPQTPSVEDTEVAP